jgi:putative CRISPR-associated protein (TIGR02619 family)
MKELHIINVGTSIISNYKKGDIDINIKNAKLSDNKIWEYVLENHNLMEKIFQFVLENPKACSAELNSFLRMVEGKNNDIEVYFLGTKTPVNEICIRTLERFMKENGYKICVTKEFPGYYFTYSKNKADEFKKGISDMLDHLLLLANKKKSEGYRVYFNPTGGFKAHVIACALAGFMSYSEVYYLNEEFDDLIVFPYLFYIPKNKEIELLQLLKERKNISKKELEFLWEKYSEEIERLKHYGLIDEIEIDDTYRIHVNSKALILLEELSTHKK